MELTMELRMDTISDEPSKNLFQKGTFFSKSTPCAKNVYIKRLAAAIVDKYIMNRQAGEEIVKQALNEREQAMVKKTGWCFQMVVFLVGQQPVTKPSSKFM